MMIRQNWYVHLECNFIVINTSKYCLVVLDMAAIFQDGHQGVHWTTTLCLKVAADRQNDLGNKWYVLNFKKVNFDFISNQIVQMFAIWLPFYNMRVIDNDE